jgi:hypothetical protein
MTESFITDFDGFVYAEELVRAVQHVTGDRPKSKAAAKQHLQAFLAREPGELEQHLKAVLNELLAEDLARWSKERLGIKMTKAQAIGALAAWYAGSKSSEREQQPVEMTRAPTATTSARAAAQYFEDNTATTRADYYKLDLQRDKGELRVEGVCPSCGAHHEFVHATKRQVGAVARVLGGLFSEPVKTVADMFTSAESIEMSCSQCQFGVTICGHCDQINAHDATKCTWCGHAIL